ncbi:hypothetical protein [Pontibacter ruber]|uniref:STAS/SEC14 domain-containing protein n=1 Tax=Pontibacter ruber TaxID=1343895 RepID=A0ABW5D1E7_9BACT|nr:hypothetical protein [Pontibacter ruber]
MKTLQPAHGQPEKQLNTHTANALTNSAETEYLTFCFLPAAKCLEARWHRPVSSKEYKQGIRSIAVCIATLRAKMLLIDFTMMGTPTIADQNWTASFLKEVMKHSLLRYCARVLSTDEAQLFAHEVVVDKVHNFPYISQVFTSEQEAKAWLFKDMPAADGLNERIAIPFNFNLKELRKLNLQPHAASDTQNPTPVTDKADTVSIEYRTDYVEIKIDKKKSLLSLRWLRPPQSREYRYSMLKAARAVLEHKLEIMLLINYKLGVLTLADQSWVVHTTTNIANRANLKKLAIVASPDSLQQTMSDSICSKLECMNLPYTLQYFLTEDEARMWLLA